jgi:hypothetical protein
VKIDPGIAGFSQQDAGFAAPRVYLQQLQCLLIARLSLYRQELAAREPVHARQVDIRFLADIHPAQVGTVGRNHSEPYEYVRRAGRRIALLVNLEVLGIYLEPLRHVYGGFVDADKSDRRVVRRPPVTGVSVHLFLGDEFGHAVANEPAAVMGQPELVEGVQVDGEEVLVANEGHVPAGGAELRVGLTRLGVGELSCLVTVEIVEEQVTVEREQQAITGGRKLVAHDTALADDAQAFAPCEFLFGQGLVARDQRRGVNQEPHLPVRKVVLPKVHL